MALPQARPRRAAAAAGHVRPRACRLRCEPSESSVYCPAGPVCAQGEGRGARGGAL